MNYTKGSTSIMFCGTATGELLPVYVVYKAINMWNTWTLGGLTGARFNRSKSDWFDAPALMTGLGVLFCHELGEKKEEK